MVLIGNISTYLDSDNNKGISIENIDHRIFWNGLTVTSFGLFRHLPFIPEYLPKLIASIKNGEIKAQVDLGERSAKGKFFGLVEVARAEQWLLDGNNLGKVVVKIRQA